MEKSNIAMKVLKYTLFVIIILVLMVLWKAFFILQGGIGLEGFFTPLKLLPIFLVSAFFFWIVMKMFDSKNIVMNKMPICGVVGGVAVVLSVTFQYFTIYNRSEPFKLKNEMFSHVPEIVHTGDFKNRLALSAAGFAKILPLGEVDNETAAYMSNAALEMAVLFSAKELMDKEKYKSTCRKYVEKYGDENSCVLDLQKDLLSQFTFSSTGNVLIIAMSALGIFRIKDEMEKVHGKKNLYVVGKASNDIIESSLMLQEIVKEQILKKETPIQYSMGYTLKPDSFMGMAELAINYKFLDVSMKKLDELLKTQQEKLKMPAPNDGERSVASELGPKLQEEIERSKQLNKDFQVLQRGGFSLEEIKVANQNLKAQMEEKFKKFKKESFLYRFGSVFSDSMEQMTLARFMAEKKSSKKALIKQNL